MTFDGVGSSYAAVPIVSGWNRRVFRFDTMRIVLFFAFLSVAAAPSLCEGETGPCYEVFRREYEVRARASVCDTPDWGLAYSLENFAGTTGEMTVSFPDQPTCTL